MNTVLDNHVKKLFENVYFNTELTRKETLNCYKIAQN